MLDLQNLKFLKDLSQNNNRDWFNLNKAEYEKQLENTVNFADKLLLLLKQHDNIENLSGKKSMMRIYRDVRFSKDKSPYKTNWGIHFKRATQQLRGGYYVNIEPGNSFVGGGFWSPEASDLKLIREAISSDEKEFRKIISSSTFQNHFGKLGLHGEKLVGVPKGFDKLDPAADLLALKQFLIRKDFSDKEVCSPEFVNNLNESFKAMRPFFDWMSYALSHDSNGVPLYQ